MSRTVSYVLGAVLAVIGLWGFALSPVLGIFDANAAHSAVHLITGVILLAVAAWWPNQNAMTLKVLGVIYAIVAIWGFAVPGEVLGFLDNTAADNGLHAVLAIILLGAGFMEKREAMGPMSAM